VGLGVSRKVGERHGPVGDADGDLNPGYPVAAVEAVVHREQAMRRTLTGTPDWLLPAHVSAIKDDGPPTTVATEYPAAV